MDPNAAIAWAVAIPGGEARDNALRSIASSWGQSDPRSAADWWLKNEPVGNPSGDGTLGQIIANWARIDQSAALTWAQGMSDSAAKQSALASIVGQMAGNEPQDAAAIVGTLTGDAQGRAAASLASRWSRSDPIAAATWAKSLPEGAARVNAIGTNLRNLGTG
jgi:hypothetical protein